MAMEIIWDERKREANIDKHELDFADLNEEFFVRATIIPARNKRLIAVGSHVRGTLVVVFLSLGREGLSVISMRPANRKERALIDG